MAYWGFRPKQIDVEHARTVGVMVKFVCDMVLLLLEVVEVKQTLLAQVFLVPRSMIKRYHGHAQDRHGQARVGSVPQIMKKGGIRFVDSTRPPRNPNLETIQ